MVMKRRIDRWGTKLNYVTAQGRVAHAFAYKFSLDELLLNNLVIAVLRSFERNQNGVNAIMCRLELYNVF